MEGEIGMVRPKGTLSVFLGDLTHDSIGLATEVFPLNIGLIAAYAKKEFGSRIDIQLFKYPVELEAAIRVNPPDVLALSNYAWSHNISRALMRITKSLHPDAITVMGGPNFPHDADGQSDFLSSRPEIDFYCFMDGELPFTNILRSILKSHPMNEARDQMTKEGVAGCLSFSRRYGLVRGAPVARLAEPDQIPSPYLTGVLDKFFDGRLHPMIQTNRGCPFRCTYCHDGSTLVDKVYHFSVDRILEELTYIAGKVPNNTKTLFVSDLNFGMFARDQRICEHIADLRKEFDYPWFIDTTTGKNSKKRVINNVKTLSGMLGVTMSVQSLSSPVLERIKRKNMRLDEFFSLKPALKAEGLDTNSEIILGLPGETIQEHFDGIDHLLSLDMDHILSYTLMMLNGTELNSASEREKWGYKTKFRVIPRDFTELSDGQRIVETEEVAVESKAMPFSDYVYARQVVLMLQVMNGRVFKPLLKWLLRRGVKGTELFRQMLSDLEQGKYPKLRSIFSEYAEATRGELFDTENEVNTFFEDPDNFAGLYSGKYGANLLQLGKARTLGLAMPDLIQLAFFSSRKLLELSLFGQRDFSEGAGSDELGDLENFARGMGYRLLSEEPDDQCIEFSLNTDVESWIKSQVEGAELSDFRFDQARRYRFFKTKKQQRHLSDLYDQFGRTELGMSKVIIRIPYDQLWRTAEVAKWDYEKAI